MKQKKKELRCAINDRNRTIEILRKKIREANEQVRDIGLQNYQLTTELEDFKWMERNKPKDVVTFETDKSVFISKNARDRIEGYTNQILGYVNAIKTTVTGDEQ